MMMSILLDTELEKNELYDALLNLKDELKLSFFYVKHEIPQEAPQ